MIDIFLPKTDDNNKQATLKSIASQSGVARVLDFPDGPVKASQTMIAIAGQAQAPYTMIYFKEQALQMGYLSTERWLQVAETGDAAMLYSDHYNTTAEGLRKDAPVIDYQQGSLRDDFDFGSLVMIRTEVLKQAARDLQGTDYQAAGWYALRLAISRAGRLEHIPEPLYSEVELDTRKSGEKLFDYVDPRNRASQIEMEQACTHHLKLIGGYLKPEFEQVDVKAGSFPVEVSVMIPVRNRIRTIRDAVESAQRQQTTFKYNIFVVENGPECHSTDGTTEAVEEMAASDPRIVHIVPTRNDLGVGGSWNACAHHASCGRFIVQLDSDDIYSGEDTLQKFYDAFMAQQTPMIIGAYQLTDINGNILPPGKIDHREWTPENGRNNALRINGLGAPRAFFSPVVRDIMLPNVCYGEDYALGLAISRRYQIGRIYDVLYNCRRWDDNSDGDLTVEKANRYNTYKDRIRTWELQARIRQNAGK